MLDYNEFTISLIRHGQSETNANPDRMGQLETTPLTDMGRHQAKLLGAKLKREKENFDLIYSSHYTRALDTAILATDYRIILAPELREYSAGDWTDASRSQTINDSIKVQMGNLGHAFLPPNGESLHQVERRASAWLEENILYNKAIQHEASERKRNNKDVLNIALFTHGMTIKCLLHYVMGFDRSFTWKIQIDNTSVSKISFGKDGWRLLSINDCSHLL
jgi:broad specificity phosphatase PhoE